MKATRHHACICARLAAKRTIILVATVLVLNNLATVGKIGPVNTLTQPLKPHTDPLEGEDVPRGHTALVVARVLTGQVADPQDRQGVQVTDLIAEFIFGHLAVNTCFDNVKRHCKYSWRISGFGMQRSCHLLTVCF